MNRCAHGYGFRESDGRPSECLICVREDRDNLLIKIENLTRNAKELRFCAGDNGINRAELAWLVEDGTGLRWRYMDQGRPLWTTDPNQAMRFARQADAEMFAAEDEDAWRITEHMWVSPPIPTEALPIPSTETPIQEGKL